MSNRRHGTGFTKLLLAAVLMLTSPFAAAYDLDPNSTCMYLPFLRLALSSRLLDAMLQRLLCQH